MPFKRWFRKHPRIALIIAVLGFLLLTLPAAWSGFSNEPLYRWLFNRIGIGNLAHFAFPLSWMLTPIGGLVFIAISWSLFGVEIRKFVRVNRLMSLAVFVISGAVLGAIAWLICRMPTSQNPAARISVRTSIATPTSSAPDSPKAMPNLAPVSAGSVKGQISWNFSSFLGLTFGGEASPKCRVHTFQAFGRNSWSTPITKLAGQLEIDGTGEKFPLLFNKDGKPVDIKEIPAVENDERVEVACYFVRDQSLWVPRTERLRPIPS